jgi:cyclopropane fatty-acyl-phospholipid synthase-like methyltransferase
MVEPPGATGPTGDWEKLYATSDVATLPWYNPDLDTDIDRALKAHRLRGGRILDLGTGPATQAMNLAKRGFDVVATDISASAIKKAKASAKEAGLSITFLVDNVLKSKLAPNLVDAIMDRGVFHVLPKEKRPVYVETVHRVLRANGWLFLKCFSDKEPGTWGPHRIAEGELLGYFRGPFEVLSVVQTVFQGNVKPAPKALFATFRRRDVPTNAGRQKRARKRSTRS